MAVAQAVPTVQQLVYNFAVSSPNRPSSPKRYCICGNTDVVPAHEWSELLLKELEAAAYPYQVIGMPHKCQMFRVLHGMYSWAGLHNIQVAHRTWCGVEAVSTTLHQHHGRPRAGCHATVGVAGC